MIFGTILVMIVIGFAAAIPYVIIASIKRAKNIDNETE